MGPPDHLGKTAPIAPFVAWHHRDRSPELAAWYQRTVGAYRGAVEWVVDCTSEIDGLRTNWTLYPKRLADYAKEHGIASPKEATEALWKAEPDFGRIATEDLNRLAEHLIAAAKDRQSATP
jgi:hypothetical protein